MRIHGRGGQGVVTAAELLSVAVVAEGKHAQAFPSFGSERSGAPVESFCRIADTRIRTRAPVMQPDALIVQDPTLLHQIDVFAGLAPAGYVLINWSGDPAALGMESVCDLLPAGHVQVVPATDLALRHVGRPVPNAALLGAFAALTGQVSLPSVQDTLRARFVGPVGEGNSAAAAEAHAMVVAARELSDATAG